MNLVLYHFTGTGYPVKKEGPQLALAGLNLKGWAAANVRQPLSRMRIQIMTLASHATIWGIKGLAEPGLTPKGLTDSVWLVAERENGRKPRNLPWPAPLQELHFPGVAS